MKRTEIAKKTNWTSASGNNLELVISLVATMGEIEETDLDGDKGAKASSFETVETTTLAINGKIAVTGFVFVEQDGTVHIRNSENSSRLDPVAGGKITKAHAEAMAELNSTDWIKAEMDRQKAIALGEVEYSNHVAKMNAIMAD